MWQMVKAGQIDTAIVAVGSKPAYDLEATLGSVRFLGFTADQQDMLGELLQGSFLAELSAASGTPGEADGVRVIAYDYALFAHKDVADKIITGVAKALYDNPDALRATSPLWKNFSADAMAKDVGVEFHPAAQAFYQKQGIWQR